MSRLSSRPNYDATTAANMIARCNQPHAVEWRANVWKGNTELAHDIPLVGGRLVLDSSDPIRRRLELEVGGGEDWAPRTPNSPLVPFGQRVNLWCRVDQADGSSWFPWLKMGEYHIVTHTFERPSQITTVECVDMAGAVDEYLFLQRKSFVGDTLHEAVVSMCEDAVPGYIFSVDSSDAARDPTKTITSFVADAGQGRWDAATEVSGRRGHECFFNADGNLVIRRSISDDDDGTIPANGPDIGTVANPIAIISDGDSGNLIGLTATLSRQGGCNGVRINLHSTVPQFVKKPGDRTGDWVTAPINTRVTELQGSGPVTWGGDFGHLPIVIERDVKDLKKWSNGGEETWSTAQDAAHRDAKRTLHRRRGITRYLDVHATPLPWLECDDKVRIRWHEFDDSADARVTTEAHYVARVEFDLSGGPMVLRTRQLATVDPG